ncbi:unnamed protein product [Adineta ricciae]|uniref:Fibronectin type-III domain-containing protein n=1 Tax=Adineta ricciae TaxID=249248 RepID=A0A813P8U8_ADIRI|nr:unnamed protein product [Adineta ricciae]CAF0869147.1 unnamed protein product [Adineta ricciae]
MNDTPHLVAHFLAAGAEKRLEDYYFLRNTYETVAGQEVQLNRILRMLGEDEISLNWRMDLSPMGRSRCRSAFEFDRSNNPLVLKGNIAYERLRDLEQQTFRYVREPSAPVTSRRVQEIRERRQRFSEQREFLPSSSSTGITYPASSSSSRSRALADYDNAIAASDRKRQQQADEKRFNASKDDDRTATDRKYDKYKTTFTDDNDESQKYRRKSKQMIDELNDRLGRVSLSYDDQNNKVSTDRYRKTSRDQDNGMSTDRYRKASSDQDNGLYSDRNRKISKDQDNEVSIGRDKKTSDNQDNGLYVDRNRKASRDQENEPYAGRGRKASEDQEENSGKTRTLSMKSDQDKTTDIELISFTVRCQTLSPSNNTQGDENISLRLLCKWASPSSSSAIDYYTIERQVSDDDWSPVGEHIDKYANQTQLDISSSTDTSNLINESRPVYFRLKAHLQNGQIFMSKPTDEIYLNSSCENNIVVPNVEVLSPSSVQLTWNDDKQVDSTKGNNQQEEQANVYNVEKKEEDIANWEKVTEVPLSQRSARIDSLTDAEHCQFRLVPTGVESESEKVAETGAEPEPELITVHNVNELLSSLHIAPSSPTKVNIDISEDGFKQYDSYKVEYTAANQLDGWKQMSNITNDDPRLTIDGLKQGTDYKFRFTPIASGTATNTGKNDVNSSQLSLILDVKTPSARRGRFNQEEDETPAATPSQSSTKDISSETKNKTENAVIDSSTEKVANESERKPSVVASSSSRSSFQQDVDEGKTATPRSAKSSIPNEIEEDANQYEEASSDKDANENEKSETKSPKTSFREDVNEDDDKTDTNAASVSAVPHFKLEKLDSTSVLIEAIVPEDEPATFEDVFDVYSKKETTEEDWTKIGTIDKENLSTKVEDLEEDTAYAFKIDNTTSPSTDDQMSTVQEFKFVTTPAKQYDPSLFLERIEESLENVVNGVMEAAAGHQVVEEPINKSLNEVIKEVFRDDTLVPSEKYGFETLALNNDLQLYRGPKQMMLKELEVDETTDSSKHYGEIIIHNYRTAHQSVVVREENGNTSVTHIDGDVIIRNVVSDVILKNEQTHLQLSMNIVGQAFLKGVQGSLIASKFRGIIVVKNVNK